MPAEVTSAGCWRAFTLPGSSSRSRTCLHRLPALAGF